MDRIKRLADYEIQELKDVISYINKDFDEELILEEMPTNLFGIALDYSFNDTEVREWIWKFIDDYKDQINVGVDSKLMRDYYMISDFPFGTPVPFEYLQGYASVVNDEMRKKYVRGE